MLERVSKYISYVSVVAGHVAGAAILFMLFLVLAEILMRTFLRQSLFFTVEVSGWLVVCSGFLGGAFALKSGNHIRVSLFTSHLSQNSWNWLDLCLNILAAGFFVWFSAHSWSWLWFHFTAKTTGEAIPYLPVYWPWIAVFLGSMVFAVQHVGSILEAIVTRRKASEKPREAGSRRSLGIVIFLILVLFSFIGILHFAPPDSPLIVLAVVILMILAAVGSGLWIYLALAIVGLILMVLFTGVSIERMAPMVAFTASNSFILAALPLFILMGELLLRSGASSDLYRGISPWVERVPGRLFHSNVISCAIFAAISGSSAATTAFVGSVAVPELSNRGYDRRLTISSLAGAGTLGLLIPPSIPMIVYGAVASQSVGQLFIGGFLPGLTIASLFSAFIMVRAIRNPSLAPPGQIHSWKERLIVSVKILPIITIILFVLGSIYAGIATPTEAAAIGAFMALIANAAYRRLSWPVLREALQNTVRTTAMIIFILVGATILSVGLGYLAIPQNVARFFLGLNLSKWMIFTLLCVLYLGMGCFFEAMSMIVLTVPIILPMLIAFDFNLVWFGIVLVVLIEAAQITPPVGINLYVLQNATGEPIESIAKWSLPFFMLLIVGILILVFFPDLALFLPSTMMK